MKVKVQKKDLENAIKLVGATVSNKDLGVRSHFVFRYKNDQFAVYTSYGRIFSSTPIPAEVSDISEDPEENRFTIEAKRLTKWLRVAGDGFVSLAFKGGVVSARAMRGSVKFRSLDPSVFPWWDTILQGSTQTAKVESTVLSSVLSFVKPFASDDENKVPALCSASFLDGVLRATDRSRMAIVQVPMMEDVGARVWAKEIGQIKKFLETKSGEIEILEDKKKERCFFLRHADGSVFGQSRSQHEFPETNVEVSSAYDDAEYKWQFDRQEMITAIDFLSVSSQEEDFKLDLKREGDQILLSLLAAAGGRVSLEVYCPEYEGEEDMDFSLDYSLFKGVLSQLKQDSIAMVIRSMEGTKRKSGYVAFKEEEEDITSFILMVWYGTH